MRKKNSLLKKRRIRNIQGKIIKNKNDDKKEDDSFIEQTYSFLGQIKKKIMKINEIRSNHIEGILNNIDDTSFKKTFNKKGIRMEDSEESECHIIFEENFDKNILNYNNENIKIDCFDSTFDCIICFKKIKKTFEFICGHKICDKCGIKCLKIKKECPICRKRF